MNAAVLKCVCCQHTLGSCNRAEVYSLLQQDRKVMSLKFITTHTDLVCRCIHECQTVPFDVSKRSLQLYNIQEWSIAQALLQTEELPDVAPETVA